MIAKLIFIVVVCGFVLVGSSNSAWAGKPASAQKSVYRVFIEQGGKRIAARKGRVTLRARPFTLVLVTPSPTSGVMVNVSFARQTFDQARLGKPLTDSGPLSPGHGMAEGKPGPSLWASDKGSHYLFKSRFHRVKDGPGRFLGYRDVQFIVALDSSKKKLPIASLRGKRLYLSLLRSVYKDGRAQEAWRAALELSFTK
jgi:hypothetical protein